jgi:4-amino-4-deoxy-L-arabinose transferase-like glycosyltransferase
MFTILLIFIYIFIAAGIYLWSTIHPDLKQYKKIFHQICALLWIIVFPLSWLYIILK